jgi:hypothetical protein
MPEEVFARYLRRNRSPRLTLALNLRALMNPMMDVSYNDLFILPIAKLIIFVTKGLPSLPGCNPIQSGPASATAVSGCGAPTTYLPGGPTGTPTPQSSTTVGPATTTVGPVTTTAGPSGATQTKYGQCAGQGVSLIALLL